MCAVALLRYSGPAVVVGALFDQMLGSAQSPVALGMERNRWMTRGGEIVTMRILGVDLGVRATHVATLCDETGAVIWTRQRFRTRCEELAKLSARVGEDSELMVVMEPTRNAWVPVAAHFMSQGARVVLVPPERAADLRRYYAKHTKNDRLDSTVLARLPRLHPEGLNPIDGLVPPSRCGERCDAESRWSRPGTGRGNVSIRCWTCSVPATPRCLAPVTTRPP